LKSQNKNMKPTQKEILKFKKAFKAFEQSWKMIKQPNKQKSFTLQIMKNEYGHFSDLSLLSSSIENWISNKRFHLIDIEDDSFQKETKALIKLNQQVKKRN
jgi:hypothetical protein